jgi:hypothetical protein
LNCDFVPLVLCAKAGGADIKGYEETQTDSATSSYKTTLRRITFCFIVANIVGLRKKLSYSAMCVSFFSGLFVRNIFAPLDTNESRLKDSQEKTCRSSCCVCSLLNTVGINQHNLVKQPVQISSDFFHWVSSSKYRETD